jgi:hypothetical protein
MTIFDIFKTIGGFLFDISWIWLPVILAIAFFDAWMYYIRRVYWQGIDWIVLEINPPRDIDRTPKIMEQVFAGFWGIFGTVGTKYEKYIEGKIQDYFSAEIVGIGGEIHFFMRLPSKFRNLVEAQIYSQYPQAEIKEVDDYVNNLPTDIPNKNWNLWGARLALVKNEAFPIRTYMQQIDIISRPTAPPFIDPLGGLMEVLSKLKKDEQIWIQIVFRPVADKWTEKSKKLVADLMAKTSRTSVPTEEGDVVSVQMLSPGEREIIGLVEQKAAKKAYESKIQFAYFGRQEVFSMANVGATFGLFNQFAGLNTNVLKPDSYTITKAYYLFAKERKIYKQRRLLRMMKQRSFWERGYILNIEELASLFHFPTTAVKAPMTPWLEMKRAEPPLGLPTAQV